MANLSSKVTPSGVATAAQGALADSAVQPNDSPTFGTVTASDTTLDTGANSYLKFQDSTGTNGYRLRANVSNVADYGFLIEGLAGGDLLKVESDGTVTATSYAGDGSNLTGLSTPPELTQVQVEDDTSTVFGQVSGQRLAQAFDANEQQIGVGQTWQSVTRVGGVTYQNTTGKPIQVSLNYSGSGNETFQVSQDNVTFLTIARFDDDAENFTGIIPNNYYYKTSGGSWTWLELR